MAYTRLDRKVALLRAGRTAREVAEALGCTEQLVSYVLSGKRTTGPKAREVMAYLAELWGVPVPYAWPGSVERTAGRRATDQ